MFAIGLIGTLTANLLIGICSLVFEHTAILPFLVLALTVIFLGFMQTFVAPVCWVVISEIFPLKMRATGMGMAIFFLWMTVYAVTFIFPILIGYIGIANTFFVFVVLEMFSLIFVKFFMPETKGLSMEDIERKFRNEYSTKHNEKGHAKYEY